MAQPQAEHARRVVGYYPEGAGRLRTRFGLEVDGVERSAMRSLPAFVHGRRLARVCALPAAAGRLPRGPVDSRREAGRSWPGAGSPGRCFP